MTQEVDFSGLRFMTSPRGKAKYEHLRAEIAAAIEVGHFRAGAKLPPEIELAAQTKLSLGTVQRAFRELVVQGYVVRRPGTGTFIADRGKRMEEPLHCRFLNEETGQLLSVYSKLLRRQRVTGKGPWSKVLGAGKDVLRLDRTIDIDGHFSVASRLYVDVGRFPDFEKMPKQKFIGVNIKKLLHTQFSVDVSSVEQKMRVTKADAEISKWLNLARSASVLQIEGVAYDNSKNAVYFQELWMPATKYPLLVHVNT